MFDAIGCIVASKYFFFFKEKFNDCFGLFLF